MTINVTKLWLYTPQRVKHDSHSTSVPFYVKKDETTSKSPKIYFIQLEQPTEEIELEE
jgi:hypothetical protein